MIDIVPFSLRRLLDVEGSALGRYRAIQAQNLMCVTNPTQNGPEALLPEVTPPFPLVISDRAEFKQRLTLAVQNGPKITLPVGLVGVTRVHSAQLAYFQKAAQMLVRSQNHVL